MSIAESRLDYLSPAAAPISQDSDCRAELQPSIWWQALYSRDQRFDGRFFIGAATTKIYCRPICPVPFARPNNLVWFASVRGRGGCLSALRAMPSASFSGHPGVARYIGHRLPCAQADLRGRSR